MLVSLLPLATSLFLAGNAQTCPSDTSFLLLDEFVNSNGDQQQFVLFEWFDATEAPDRLACEAKCCENVSKGDTSCWGYSFYESADPVDGIPQWGPCKLFYTKFWDTGVPSLTAKQASDLVIHTYRYKEGACEDTGLDGSAHSNYEDLTMDHPHGSRGYWSTQTSLVVADETECQGECCDALVCEAYSYNPTYQTCNLMGEGYLFAKTQTVSDGVNTSMLQDPACQGHYVGNFDNAHHNAAYRDQWFVTYVRYDEFSGVRSEKDCRELCCTDLDCKGYSYYTGTEFPSDGRCTIYWVNFWQGSHHVSAFGKIKSMKKIAMCDQISDETQQSLDDTWADLSNSNKFLENGFWSTYSWFQAGSEDQCAQACCDFTGFKCGGYQYYGNGQRDQTCKLMIEGYEIKGFVAPSSFGDIKHGVLKHHACELAQEIVTDTPSYFSAAGYSTEANMGDCEVQCSSDPNCTGIRFYDSNTFPENGNCRLNYIRGFERGGQGYTSFESLQVRVKKDDGSYRDAVRMRDDAYFQTIAWRRTGNEDACRNTCCNWTDFPCTAYTFYGVPMGTSESDCKLMMNINTAVMEPSSAAIAPKHGIVNDYLNSMCAFFKRETQLFSAVTFYDTQRWFDVANVKECEQMACDNKMMSYTFYSSSPPSYGNCKALFGDLRNGVHKASSKTGLLHGVAKDLAACKYQDWTQHDVTDSANGYFASYVWSETTNESECQARCCDNSDKFRGGCGGYSYYRPGERASKYNCKTMMKGMHLSERTVHESYTWAVHGLLPPDIPDNSNPTPTPGTTDCGFALKKIKIEKSDVSKSNVADACACQSACASDPFWVFMVKKKECQCHNGVDNGRKIKINKVKLMKPKQVKRAKAFSNVNKKN